MIRAYLDTNVLAYSLHINTNSWKLLELAIKGQVEIVVSDYLLGETRDLVKRLHGKDFFSKLLYTIDNIPCKVRVYEFQLV